MNTTTRTWEERIAAVATVLSSTHDSVTTALSQWGIDKEPMGLEMLDDDDVCKFGDFQQRFGTTPDGAEVKLAQLRLAFKFLKGNQRAADRPGIDNRTLELRQKFGVKPTLESADLADLLQVYYPTKPHDPITRELVRRYGNDPAVAFMPDTDVVDVEATLAYLGDLSARSIVPLPRFKAKQNKKFCSVLRAKKQPRSMMHAQHPSGFKPVIQQDDRSKMLFVAYRRRIKARPNAPSFDRTPITQQ